MLFIPEVMNMGTVPKAKTKGLKRTYVQEPTSKEELLPE
jgi:hypothetical protein